MTGIQETGTIKDRSNGDLRSEPLLGLLTKQEQGVALCDEVGKKIARQGGLKARKISSTKHSRCFQPRPTNRSNIGLCKKRLISLSSY